MSKPPDNANTPVNRALLQDDFIVLRISRIGQALGSKLYGFMCPCYRCK
ncbi:MAG TPA: hypothetical protein VJ731_01245 [Terriglobales bacterium]|nr:hypothetical protein [Terriglobales bacterium]